MPQYKTSPTHICKDMSQVWQAYVLALACVKATHASAHLETGESSANQWNVWNPVKHLETGHIRVTAAVLLCRVCLCRVCLCTADSNTHLYCAVSPAGEGRPGEQIQQVALQRQCHGAGLHTCCKICSDMLPHSSAWLGTWQGSELATMLYCEKNTLVQVTSFAVHCMLMPFLSG
jgi:hypothetical protein